MALPDILFNSNQAIDKITYTHNDTVVVPANSVNYTTTFAHGEDYPFLPLISYSHDGDNWYSNGASSFQFDGGFGGYAPVLYGYATSDNTNVTIYWSSGNFGSKNVEYRIEGISRD